MSFFAALFFAAALWCAVCQADIVMSLTKITGETAEAVEAQLTNVPNYSSVKYAINYGNNSDSYTVNNPIGDVTFVNKLGSQTQNGSTGSPGYYYVRNADNAYNSAQQSYASHNSKTTLADAGNDYKATQSPELNNLLSSMLYTGGQPANSDTTVTFGNLEAGKTYTARLLARSWNTSDSTRQHSFSIDLNADGIAEEFYSNILGNNVTSQIVSEDQPFSGETYVGAYAVDFTFTAQSNTASINLHYDRTNGSSWHNYGVMLLETSATQALPTTPTIYNGSFETDKFVITNHSGNTAQHGYIGESNAGLISGWQFVNLSNNTPYAGLAWKGSACQDFLGNQTPPDGNQVAFLQSNNNDSRLYQNVYGFNPEDKDTVYRVSMDLGGRISSSKNPSFSLFIGQDQNSEKVYVDSKEVTKGTFKEYGAIFIPNAEMQTIAIRNQTGTDTTLLIDNVQLQAYELTTFFSDNFNVSGNRKGPNIGTNASDPKDKDRFAGGLLGGLAYKVSVKSNDQIQVGNGDNSEALFFATHNNGYDQSHASPDYNFANVGAMSAADEGGRMYDISFRVAPQHDEGSDSSNWAAVIFGLSQSQQTSVSVNGKAGVGMLFRRNGGIQVFDGTNNSNAAIVDLPSGTFALTDDWADVRVVYYVPDFNGTSPVEVSLYVNDKLISSFQTEKGFKDNFIQLEAYSSGDGYKRSLVDDFIIKSTAELQYDVSRIQDMNREWAPNGKDKLDVFFNAPRSDGATEAIHTGAITLDDDVEINVDEGYTLKQTGKVTGNHTITKKGDGVLQIYGAAIGDVDIESLVVSSGRVDVKGYMTGSVLVGKDAVFSPGNSVGSVVIDGEFQTEALATLLFEQDASGMDSLTASSFDLDDNTQFVLDITAIVPGATYDIIISSDEDFTEADSVWLDKLSEIVPDYFDFSIVDNHIVRLYTNPNKVPEPSTWALLVLGIVVLLLRKRS
ncbi:MAG: PEP-CTERM sorting domain-containing protein [Thermoguttaceae bacterium]|nr:PEP-CTERM sorting domain-containing protein [Thermoguttaceae bacterium]